jgi:hypothetical protein
MPTKKYIISLTQEERQQIEIVARSYRHSARERSRAKILLLADENQEGGSLKDHDIAQQVHCTQSQVEKMREKAIERGAVEALKHKVQERRRERKLDGEAEANLSTLACSKAPDGRKRWTLQMLADKLIQMQVVESIDRSTIYRTMKKTR